MVNPDSKKNVLDDNTEYRNLAKNTAYSFFNSYMPFFFTIFNNFIIARLISINDWGLLGTALSYVSIVTIIINFLPPGLNYALNFYIPKYIALDQKANLRSLIKNALLLKILFLLPVFIISVLIFSFFLDLFVITLNDKFGLLFILSPLIIVNALEFIILAIDQGLNRYRLISIFFLARKCIYTGVLILIFFMFNSVDVEVVANVNLYSNILPFIIFFIINILILMRISPKDKQAITLKDDFCKTSKYGTYVGSSSIIAELWNQAKIQGIATFKTPTEVLGYNIGIHLEDLGVFTFRSFHYPLVTSFSSFHAKEDLEKISVSFKIAVKGSLFILLLISGILFYTNEFILYFIYSESYLVFQITVRLLMIALVFRVLTSLVESLLNVEHKVKYLFFFQLGSMIYYIPLYFIPLITLGLYPALIFGLILGNLISFIILLIIVHRIGGISLNIKNLTLQYLTFFISLGISILLNMLVLSEFNSAFFYSLNLEIFKYLNLFPTIIFIISYLLTNLLFRTIKAEEIGLFESYFSGKGYLDSQIRKLLKLFKKFTRR